MQELTCCIKRGINANNAEGKWHLITNLIANPIKIYPPKQKASSYEWLEAFCLIHY
jgi:hypothetical protein